MRIATWNVNSLKARLPRVEAWLAEVEPDVVCLQETKCADTAFPAMAFQSLGYEAVHHGSGRWNGVAILSRVGIDDPVAGFADGGAGPVPVEPDGGVDAGDASEEARLLTASCGGVRVLTVYVPNGRAVGHPHYHYKLEWLARLRKHLDAVADPGADVVVAGDFNIAPEDRDVWDPAAFSSSTHVTEPERAALAGLLEWGLVDVFRRHHPEPGLFTWWDYRAGDFHKKRGMRIDLLLASPALAERSAWSLVDRNARKGTSPSDHAPLVAELG